MLMLVTVRKDNGFCAKHEAHVKMISRLGINANRFLEQIDFESALENLKPAEGVGHK